MEAREPKKVRLCGAKLRKSDPPRYCRKPPLRGRARCRLHGGASPRGPASASYKDGRHSLIFGVPIPGGTPFGDAVSRALADHELRGLRREIAVASGLLAEATTRVVLGGGGKAEWSKASELFGQLKQALLAGRIPKAKELLVAVEAILVRGMDATTREAEASDRADLLRRLRRDEARIAALRGGSLTAEEFLAAARAWAELGMEFIDDVKRRQDFVRKFEGIVTSGRIISAALPAGEEA